MDLNLVWTNLKIVSLHNPVEISAQFVQNANLWLGMDLNLEWIDFNLAALESSLKFVFQYCHSRRALPAYCSINFGLKSLEIDHNIEMDKRIVPNLLYYSSARKVGPEKYNLNSHCSNFVNFQKICLCGHLSLNSNFNTVIAISKFKKRGTHPHFKRCFAAHKSMNM